MARKKLRHIKILIVEDSEALNHLLRKRLESEGLKTEYVHNGGDAIQWALKNPDSILIIDYRLPDIYANKVILRLKEKT